MASQPSALSTKAAVRLIDAAGSTPQGQELVTSVNTGLALAAQSAQTLAAVIVATSTSTTTDFGALKVGDKVVHIPATAGNAQFGTVSTVGTAPFAAVVGDLYLVLRAWTPLATVTTTPSAQ